MGGQSLLSNYCTSVSAPPVFSASRRRIARAAPRQLDAASRELTSVGLGPNARGHSTAVARGNDGSRDFGEASLDMASNCRTVSITSRWLR